MHGPAATPTDPFAPGGRLRHHGTFVMIAIIFLATRFAGIGRLPVYHDEAMYMSWTRAMADDPSRAYLPLLDGKTPLFYWMASAMPGLREDPLGVLRRLSGAAGLASLVLLYAAGCRFWGRAVGNLAAFLYTFSPLPLFLERMAHVDAWLSAWGLAALFATVATLDNRWPFRKGALALGAAAGLGFLTKQPALLWLPSLLAVVRLWRGGLWLPRRRLLLWGAAAAGMALAFARCATADHPRLLPVRDVLFHIPPFRGNFWLSPERLLQVPFDVWGGNFARVGEILWRYLPWTLLAPAAVGLARPGRPMRAVALWCAAPVCALALVLYDIPSRFLLFATVPLVLPAACGLLDLARRWGKTEGAAWAAAGACALPGALFAWHLATDPARAAWLPADREAYISGDLAGDGLDEAARFFKARAREEGAIDLFVYRRWGVPSDVMEAVFRGDPEVRVWMVHWGDNVLTGHPPVMGVLRNQYTQEMGALDVSRVARAYLILRHDYATDAAIRAANPGAVRLRGYGRTADGRDKYVVWCLR